MSCKEGEVLREDKNVDFVRRISFQWRKKGVERRCVAYDEAAWTALSDVDLTAPPRHEQNTLAIPQLVAEGTVEERPVLPSFLYLPSAEEFPEGSLTLPWDRSSSDLPHLRHRSRDC